MARFVLVPGGWHGGWAFEAVGNALSSAGHDFGVVKMAAQPSMPQLVFVFGTLKEGFPNFATNKGVRVPGDFMTVERYPLYLVGDRFSPWLLDAAGEGERVVGQVFEVDEAALAAMDDLERIAERDGYRRVMLEVQALGNGRRAACRAHAYIKPQAQFTAADARLGPLGEYTREHAALYRSREMKPPAPDAP